MKNLEYEGDYSYNRKWNGKGYDINGNIIYELINGNGKVKEYYHGGKLQFEGEYLNGKRNGVGKSYYEEGEIGFIGIYLNEEGGENVEAKGELEYEGEYLNGKKNGKGKEYANGKLEYEGEFLNGNRIQKK